MAARWRSPAFLSLVVAGTGAVSAVGVVAFIKARTAAQYSSAFNLGQFLFGCAFTASPYFGIAVLAKVFARRPASIGVVLGGSIFVTLLGEVAYLSTVIGLNASQGQSSHMGGPGLVTGLMPFFQWLLLGFTTLAAAIISIFVQRFAALPGSETEIGRPLPGVRVFERIWGIAFISLVLLALAAWIGSGIFGW
jgi:hypothetical protein